MQKVNFFVRTLLLISLMAGCSSNTAGQSDGPSSIEDYRMPTDLPTPSSLTEAAQTEIASSIPPVDCPVTTAGSLSFEAPAPHSPRAPWTGIFWFGSEHLWTALHENGVWSSLPESPDGYTQKIMWWSTSYSLPNEPRPALVVSGRRLDAEAPGLRFYGATNAMADDIGEAMLTGVEFPTLGCWEVQGQYKKASLTFVVWIAP
ncbi:MAG: hypothetical protein IH588_07570 [Anaerolineales bacterium]|nr:hypothetical protein [Anaerolineales bacterium]